MEGFFPNDEDEKEEGVPEWYRLCLEEQKHMREQIIKQKEYRRLLQARERKRRQGFPPDPHLQVRYCSQNPVSSDLFTSPRISRAQDSHLHVTLSFSLTETDRAAACVRIRTSVKGASELSITHWRRRSETFRYQASEHDMDRRGFRRRGDKAWEEEEVEDDDDDGK